MLLLVAVVVTTEAWEDVVGGAAVGVVVTGQETPRQGESKRHRHPPEKKTEKL